MVDDAVLLRRQHENLARRRSYAIGRYDGDEELVKKNVGAIMKQHRKEFENSEAQKVQRRYQSEQLGFGCGYNIYIYMAASRLLCDLEAYPRIHPRNKNQYLLSVL